jgi:hypothetical protein
MFSVWLAFLKLIPFPGLDVFARLVYNVGNNHWKACSTKVFRNNKFITNLLFQPTQVLIFGNDIVKENLQFLRKALKKELQCIPLNL